MSIFMDVHFLIKQLYTSIAAGQDISNSIVIDVTLNSLHDDFSTIIETMLE